MLDYAMNLYMILFLLTTGAKVNCGTVDVLLVLDGSGSLSTADFFKVKNWVKNITKIFKPWMKSGEVQIGVVQYSHYFRDRPMEEQKYMKTEIKIGEYKIYEQFAEAVDGIKHHSFTTYTGRALEKVVADFRASERFGMEGNRQVMLLLTDGKSNDADIVERNAEKLRSLKIITYAVGVGEADKEELLEIAGTSSRIYTVKELDQLDSLQLAQKLETAIVTFLQTEPSTVGTHTSITGSLLVSSSKMHELLTADQPEATTSRAYTQNALSLSSALTSSSTALGCQTFSLTNAAVAAISTCIGIIAGIIVSSVVWWRLSKRSNKESVSDEKQEPTYEPTYVDGKGLESPYEVVNQETVENDGQVIYQQETHINSAYEVIR